MSYLDTWLTNLNTVSQKLSQNKDLLKDKVKAKAIADLTDSVKEMKSWKDKQTELGKKIDELKKARLALQKAQSDHAKKETSVQTDVTNFYTGVAAYFNDADKLADRLKKISPDTPKKEFLIAANNLADLKVDKMKSETDYPPP